jgi:hypothetical protein
VKSYLTTENSALIKALSELDKELYNRYDKNIQPIAVNVIGGFGLLLHNVRKNPDMFTDIDFIGEDLEPHVKKIADKIGTKYNLGRNWLNNDISLIDSSLESVENMIGKIHFEPVTNIDLKIFKLNVADPQDLLRMKVFAIDTWLMGMPANEPYSRTKDFEDIRLLIDYLNINMDTLKLKTKKYTLIPETYQLIDKYIKTQKNRLTHPEFCGKTKSKPETIGDLTEPDITKGLGEKIKTAIKARTEENEKRLSSFLADSTFTSSSALTKTDDNVENDEPNI